MNTYRATAVMLEAYCEWLNTWAMANDQESPYKPEQFTMWDPTNDLYGKLEVAATYRTVGYDTVVLNFTDGDEGGPHTLTAYFDDTDGKIQYMTQEFDTPVHFIITDREFTNVP